MCIYTACNHLNNINNLITAQPKRCIHHINFHNESYYIPILQGILSYICIWTTIINLQASVTCAGTHKMMTIVAMVWRLQWTSTPSCFKWLLLMHWRFSADKILHQAKMRQNITPGWDELLEVPETALSLQRRV